MVDIKPNRRNIKKGIDAEQGRRRRTDTTIQIRKSKKEENLQKRRAMKQEAEVNKTDTQFTATEHSIPSLANESKNIVPSTIPECMALLQNSLSTEEELKNGIVGFRKMLAVEHNPPVQEVLDAGALPIFVRLLGATCSKIVFEAAWALTNIASTDFTNVVAGAIPKLVQLLMHGDANVREQSAWCLGNIAGDSPVLRDQVFAAGGLQPLLTNIANPEHNSLLINCVWALSNFCRGKPQPDLALVAPAIPHLANLLSMNNNEALTDALWALSYLSDGSDERIRAVMQGEGIVENIIKLLGHENSSIVSPAVRILGNFVSGDDYQTQAVVDAGMMNYAANLLVHPKKGIRKETCWLISNIAAGNRTQIGHLMRHGQAMNTLVQLARDASWEVKKEAVWALSNIATGGADDHVHSIVELGAIESLCSVLDASDTRIVMIVLEAIDKILNVGQVSQRNYSSFVDESDGLDKMEQLQEHENVAIYDKVVLIIEKYYGAQEEEENENLAPEVNGGTFSFGMTADKSGMNGEGAIPQQPLQPFNFNY